MFVPSCWLRLNSPVVDLADRSQTRLIPCSEYNDANIQRDPLIAQRSPFIHRSRLNHSFELAPVGRQRPTHVRVQRCTERLSNSVSSGVPEGPPSFAVDMSAPPYSASESRSPTGLSPDDVLPARSTPDVVRVPCTACSRHSRLRLALTRTSHSDLAPGRCANKSSASDCICPITKVAWSCSPRLAAGSIRASPLSSPPCQQ